MNENKCIFLEIINLYCIKLYSIFLKIRLMCVISFSSMILNKTVLFNPFHPSEAMGGGGMSLSLPGKGDIPPLISSPLPFTH